ncbi:hypothetical protein [Synechococcus sp. CCAP 1479/9]|uniref:hypothetical protein n=1 Tax=Synechococcus sp. CCAP 1479/9 TaxID=1221593 RepID=UPI001C2406BB|nr:hypothetical protein [Synechococcus sp. CCAP 1479/9]
MSPDALRWQDYFLRHGDGFDQFWQHFLAERERDLLFILGYGFDARMCDGIERILGLGGIGRRDVALVTFNEGDESPSQDYADMCHANGERIRQLTHGRGIVNHRMIKMFSADNRRVGARSIAQEFASQDEFRSYSDVVVDISALPRSLYMPLLSKLLALFDSDEKDNASRNLHVIVSHSPDIDGSITEEGLEESATYLHGFAAAALESESSNSQPKIWIPVLGKGQQVQLERINQFVNPDEICPVLPSPAQDPREGDSIMIEYRELLFDQLRLDPRNIIYASESNPFEVYRQLMRSILQYSRALKPLGGCKVALSAMSSKLASIGVILAAYELARVEPRVLVGVAHVEAQGYSCNSFGATHSKSLYTMCLFGECYVR